jgi:uncharacterized protein YwqG
LDGKQKLALDLLPLEARSFVRTAYLPATEPAEIGRSSGFGGRAHLPEGVEHPVCPNCAQPMPLLAQLALSELPDDARPEGSGLLQVFYCSQAPVGSDMPCDVDLEGWAAFSKAHCVRLVPDGPGQPSPAGIPHPDRRVVGWSPIQDYPNGEELRDLGLAISDSVWDALGEADIPRSGEKLGGWPNWIQGVEYPNCPECGNTMGLVLQIDSDQNVPVMFGDMGIGHVTQCKAHPRVLAFAWACS